MVRKFTLAGGAALTAVLLGAGVYVSAPSASEPQNLQLARALAAAGTPKLKQVYASWVEGHEAMGGDRNVEFVLGRTDLRAHGQRSSTSYTGYARLDVIDGRVDVQVGNLPAGKSYEAWLVDDRPGDANSILADGDDVYVRVGELEQNGSEWTLSKELDGATFRDFQVDQLVVTTKGEHPTEGVILSGKPTFFQRLYTSLRTPELYAASDFVVPGDAPADAPIFGVRSAFADRVANPKPIEVDPDVVLDNLVRLGADIFINENFNGNGRTCETCHPFLNNITIDPSELARRPDNDPIFLAENNPNFAAPAGGLFPLDIPPVLRATSLIGIPDDSADNPTIQRSVPHLFAVNTSFGPAAPVVLPFGSPGAPPTPFPLPDPNDPNDPGRQFGLDLPLPPAGPGLPGGQAVPGGGFPAFGFTVDNATNPPIDRLGFGGDLGFAPELGLFGRLGDAVPGAVVTLLTQRPNGVPGTDFRLPTPQEVDAVVAFYLTLGRSQEMQIQDLRLSDPVAERGRQIFINPGGFLANFPNGTVTPVTDQFGAPIGAGKCNVCHNNAGAKTDKVLFDAICAGLAQTLNLPVMPQCGLTNFNFETGVEQLPSQPARVVAGRFSVFGPPDQTGIVPVDGGFGLAPAIPGATPDDVMAGRAPCFTTPELPGLAIPEGGFGTVIGIDFPFTNPQVRAGACSEEFNTPPLVEAADTAPFFHNNNASTLEGAVEFYNTRAFRESSAGVILGAVTDGNNGITLENTEVQAISSFLRVINALENLRSAREFVETARGVNDATQFSNLLDVALAQLEDAMQVLEGAKLLPRQVDQIGQAAQAIMRVQDNGPVLQVRTRSIFFFGRRIEVPIRGGNANQANNGLDAVMTMMDQATAGLQQPN